MKHFKLLMEYDHRTLNRLNASRGLSSYSFCYKDKIKIKKEIENSTRLK